MDPFYLDAIKKSEGFSPRASWDYRQDSNGYGTRAQYPGEVIDKAEAERRFQAEIAAARSIVDRFAPSADEGTKAALTSLTFNAGDKWTRSGLGKAIQAGDIETARNLFQQYNKAGGQELPGLASRRQAEAQWFGGQAGQSPAQAPYSAPQPGNMLAAASGQQTQKPAENNVLDFIRASQTKPFQLADNTGAAQRVVENYLKMSSRV